MRGENDHERERGDDKYDICQAHQHLIYCAAHVAGEQTHQSPYYDRDEGGKEAYKERNARAIDQLAEDVLADVVCAEGMLPAGRQEGAARLPRVEGRDEGSEYGED